MKTFTRVKTRVAKWALQALMRGAESDVINPQEWLLTALQGAPTKAGPAVNTTTAMNVATLFAVVDILSAAVGMLPRDLYRRGRGDDRTADRGHPISNLLRIEPNPDMTTMDVFQTTTMHALLWGHGDLQVIRNRKGDPVELWPLRPENVQIERNTRTGQIQYRVTDDLGAQETLPRTEIIRLKGMSYDGYTGYSLVGVLRETLGTVIGMTEHYAHLVSSGMVGGGILTPPPQLKGQALTQYMSEFLEKYQGLGKSDKSFITLMPGMELKGSAIPPADAEFLAMSQYLGLLMCQVSHVPPSMVGLTQDTNRSTATQEAVSFVKFGVLPWTTRWEQAFNGALIPAAERGRLFMEHNVAGLLKGDPLTEAKTDRELVMGAVLTPNEARAHRNLPGVPGGDQLLVPSTMVAAETLGKRNTKDVVDEVDKVDDVDVVDVEKVVAGGRNGKARGGRM